VSEELLNRADVPAMQEEAAQRIAELVFAGK